MRYKFGPLAFTAKRLQQSAAMMRGWRVCFGGAAHTYLIQVLS